MTSVMTLSREPGRDKARWHYDRADTYQQLADELMEQSRTVPARAEILVDTAGAVLYEAAKQAVNAVANLRGRDPQDNHAKILEIRSIMADGLTPLDLLRQAHAAWQLHIHADQGNLTPASFSEHFANATAFVEEMQAIYLTLDNAG